MNESPTSQREEGRDGDIEEEKRGGGEKWET